MTSTTIVDTAPTPKNSSLQETNIPSTSQNVDELKSQQLVQHLTNQVPHQPKIVADNVPNAMLDGDVFENSFAPPSTSAAELSSLQYVDPSNMHRFYEPYPHEYQWTKDHPLEKVIGEPSRPVLTRNQLQTDGDMCMYALTVSTMEPSNVKEAMHDPAWTESIMEAIKIFLAYAAHKSFTMFQMDVKTAFLHDTLKKDMYVCQPEGAQGLCLLCEESQNLISSIKISCSQSRMILALDFLSSSLGRMEMERISKESGFELTAFSDVDYAGCKDTFKSTSTISIYYNPVQHSRTNHIAVRYHFIKEHMEKGTIELYFVKTDYQLVKLFTKALPMDRFNYLVCRFGMRSLSPQELERLVKSRQNWRDLPSDTPLDRIEVLSLKRASGHGKIEHVLMAQSAANIEGVCLGAAEAGSLVGSVCLGAAETAAT
nr:retrovirus-related Pol polyprotein from transposon TNT 1-94 [Tanacetum cinerariifolium]